MNHPTSSEAPAAKRPVMAMQPPDVREKGLPVNGEPQVSNRRLFFQLLAFGNVCAPQDLIKSLEESSIPAVLYADFNDAKGVGLLFFDENPDRFVSEIRNFLLQSPFSQLTPKPELTMTGRTYSIGREQDLEDWLLRKPVKNVLNADWPWAIWYPLRRKAEFSLLSPQEQGKILMEHGMIGRSYGDADLAHDVRLACHGLDQNDNEFVIGLIGKELYPLSRIVQDMRKTEQTSKYIQSLGPFFVGKAIWQSTSK